MIESFHPTDYVSCSCNEISVSGGHAMRMSARDFANFVRVDDEDNEIEITVREESEIEEGSKRYLTTDDLMSELDRLIETIEKLPTAAKHSPIDHLDHCASLMLFSSIIKSLRYDNQLS